MFYSITGFLVGVALLEYDNNVNAFASMKSPISSRVDARLVIQNAFYTPFNRYSVKYDRNIREFLEPFQVLPRRRKRNANTCKNRQPWLVLYHTPTGNDFCTNDDIAGDKEDSSPSVSSYLATCIPGLGIILVSELQKLNCVNVEIQSSSAVAFQTTDVQTILNVLLWARTPHKILELLCTTDTGPDSQRIKDRNDLHNFVSSNVDVKDLLGNGAGGLLTLAVSVTLNNARHVPPDINHSHYTALTIKNAIVDTVRELRNNRPSIDLDDPDVPLHAIILGVAPVTEMVSPRRNYSAQFNPAMNNNNNNNNNKNELENAKIVGCYAQVTLYRQIHTGSLHRRGYRHDDTGGIIHKAAMKESLAAGLLIQAGWDVTSRNFLDLCTNEGVTVNGMSNPESLRLESKSSSSTSTVSSESSTRLVLADPMTGSGTFLLEGVMIAADIAPGIMRIKCNMIGSRRPPIVRWKHFDASSTTVEEIWRELLQRATVRAKTGLKTVTHLRDTHKLYITGSDIHEGALRLAENAVEIAGFSQIVDLSSSSCNCKDWKPTALQAAAGIDSTTCLIVCNPPWGVRLGSDDDKLVHDAWEALRYFLRQTCPASTVAWILSGNKVLTKHLGLQRSQSIPFKTGEQDLRFLQYIMRSKEENGTDDTSGSHSPSQKLLRNDFKVAEFYSSNIRLKPKRDDLAGSYINPIRFRRPVSTMEPERHTRQSQGEYRSGYQNRDSPRPSYLNGLKKPHKRSMGENDSNSRQTQPRRNNQHQKKNSRSFTESQPEDNEWLLN